MKETLKKPFVRVPLTLGLIAAFCAILVGLVHAITSDIIRERRLAAQSAAIVEIFGEDVHNVVTVESNALNSEVQSTYRVLGTDDDILGFAFVVSSTNAHGTISLVIGINDSTLVGIGEVTISQTASYIPQIRDFITAINAEASRVNKTNINQLPGTDIMAGATNSRNLVTSLLRIAFSEYGYVALGEVPREIPEQLQLLVKFFPNVELDNITDEVIAEDDIVRVYPFNPDNNDFFYITRVVTARDSSNDILGTLVYVTLQNDASWGGKDNEFAIAFGPMATRGEFGTSHTLLGLEIIKLYQTNTDDRPHYTAVRAWLNNIIAQIEFGVARGGNHIRTVNQLFIDENSHIDTVAGSTRGSGIFLKAFEGALAVATPIFTNEVISYEG